VSPNQLIITCWRWKRITCAGYFTRQPLPQRNLLQSASQATAHMRVGAFRLRIRADAVFFPHHPIHSIPSLASPLSELLCGISRNYLSILFVASEVRVDEKAQARQVVNQPFVVNTNGSTNDRHCFPSLPGRHQGRTLYSIPHLFE